MALDMLEEKRGMAMISAVGIQLCHEGDGCILVGERQGGMLVLRLLLVGE